MPWQQCRGCGWWRSRGSSCQWCSRPRPSVSATKPVPAATGIPPAPSPEACRKMEPTEGNVPQNISHQDRAHLPPLLHMPLAQGQTLPFVQAPNAWNYKMLPSSWPGLGVPASVLLNWDQTPTGTLKEAAAEAPGASDAPTADSRGMQISFCLPFGYSTEGRNQSLGTFLAGPGSERCLHLCASTGRAVPRGLSQSSWVAGGRAKNWPFSPSTWKKPLFPKS